MPWPAICRKAHTQLLGCVLCIAVSPAHAQEPLADPPPRPPHHVQTNTRLLVWGYGVGMALYGYNAWWQDNTGEFHIEGEGWFGETSYRGGADKFGHMYTTYVSTRLLSHAFHRLGNDRPRAQRLASVLVGSTTFAIEVLDGYTEDIGFSWEDLVMDAAGIGAGLVLENRPDLDAKFDFRFHYQRSSAARRLGEEDPASDYSGQTYLFITKLKGFRALRKYRPLHYVELALGYGSRGYWPTDGTQTKQRSMFYGLSLNVLQVLEDTAFRRRTSGSVQSITRGTLEYIQLPGSTALADHAL